MAFMIFCFVLASVWDGITTGFGVAAIVGANDPLGYAMCAVAGVVVLGFSVGTKVIWTRREFVFVFMRLFWLGSVAFDFYTSYIGNARYVILRNKLEVGHTLSSQLTGEQIFITLFITALVSGAPILISFLTDDTK